jgi:DNA polymerase I
LEVALELFPGSLVKDRIEHTAKTKNIGWIAQQNFVLCNDEAELKSFVGEAMLAEVVAADTETTGLNFPGEDRVVGISFAWKRLDKTLISVYVPIYSEVDSVLIEPCKTLSILKPLLEKNNLIWLNYGFDYRVFKSVGIEAGILADVSVMQLFPKGGLDSIEFSHLIKTGLKVRYKEIFSLDMLELSDILGKNIYNFALCPLSAAKSYATTDAFSTLQLYYYYLPLVDTDDFIYDLETRILKITANMSYCGIGVDLAKVGEVKAQILADNKNLEKTIYELAREKFTIGSPEALSDILYTKLKLPVMKYIEDKVNHVLTSKPSTDKESLVLLKGKHPIIEPLLEYKTNIKLVNTFLEKMQRVAVLDGRVHSSFRPFGTISGRFTSSGAMNLQQIPKSADEESYSFEIRECFIPRDGYYLVSCDFSQVEYKILAGLSQSPELLKAFEDENADFHKTTASLLFNTPPNEVTKDQRNRGKTLNFGLVYGLAAYSLAKKLLVTEQEAESLYNLYFEKMPSVKRWITKTHEEIARNGMSASHYGRIRKLPGAKSVERGERESALREGLNNKMQATSSDITKVAMVRCDKILKGKDVNLILQIHDQLIFEVSESILIDDVVGWIKKAMQIDIKGFPKLTVDTDVGYSWGGAVKWVPGMTLDQISYLKTVTIGGISNRIVEHGEELKELFKRYPGENQVFIRMGEKTIAPESVDEETGEILETRVLASKKFLNEVMALGLEIVK